MDREFGRRALVSQPTGHRSDAPRTLFALVHSETVADLYSDGHSARARANTPYLALHCEGRLDPDSKPDPTGLGSAGGTMKEKLLVLDDESRILESLEELFEEDYEVYTTD